MLVQHFVIVESIFLKYWFNIFKILDQQFFFSKWVLVGFKDKLG